VCPAGRPSVGLSDNSSKIRAIDRKFFAQVCLMNISVEFEDENDRSRNAWDIVKILKSNPAIPEGEYRDFQKKIFFNFKAFRTFDETL